MVFPTSTRKCAEHDPLITNSLPSSEAHQDILNYFIVRRTDDRHDVRVTKTVNGADC